MAAVTFVLRCHGFLIEGGYFRGVLAAFVAIDTHREIGLPLPFLRVLRAVTVEDVEYLAAVTDGVKDVFGVLSAAVHLRLVAVVHFYSEFFNGSHEFLLKIFRVALGVGIGKWIFDVDIGLSYELLEISVHLGDVNRHLSQSVKFVPRK